MYGIKRNDISIETLTVLTEKNKPLLCITYKNRSYEVGQFNDLKCAEEFFNILSYVCFGNNEDKTMEIIDNYERIQNESN